jgi:hypothetical protein
MPPPRPRPVLSERDWQKRVTAACRLHGVIYHHCRPAQHQSGAWATPIEGTPGFPDLVLVWPDGYTMFVELKAENGRLSHWQQLWLDRLGNQAEVWKPSDWPHVLETLARQVAA